MKSILHTIKHAGLKTNLIILMAGLFMASCSQKTAFVPKYDNLDYTQNYQKQNNTTPADVAVSDVVTEEKTVVAADVKTTDVKTGVVTKPYNKVKKNALAQVEKVKTKIPGMLKKADNSLAGATLLSSASQSENSATEGSSKLKIGLILLLVGFLIGIFFGWLGYIISVIGVVFIVLWLIDML